MSQIRVRQVRSAIGAPPKHRGTLRALGLGRIGKANTLPDHPQVRGMIARVPHLISVDDTDAESERTVPAAQAQVASAKPAAKKAAPKKAAPKKAAPKKAAPKKAAPKKAAPKKAAPKKAAPKKAAPKKAAPRKAAAKKAAAKKAAPKKAATKRTKGTAGSSST